MKVQLTAIAGLGRSDACMLEHHTGPHAGHQPCSIGLSCHPHPSRECKLVSHAIAMHELITVEHIIHCTGTA